MNALKLHYAEQDGQTVIQLPAHLEQDDWLGFRDLLHRQFLDQGKLHLVLDCSACPDLPSVAFGSLTCLCLDLCRASGSLQLMNISGTTRQFLARTRLGATIPVRGGAGTATGLACHGRAGWP